MTYYVAIKNQGIWEVVSSTSKQQLKKLPCEARRFFDTLEEAINFADFENNK